MSPDQICEHVGTNDLKSSTPSDVADAIIDLAREAESASESEIVISEQTTRNDGYCDAVKAVNKLLKQFCDQNRGTQREYSSKPLKHSIKNVL